MTRQASQFTDTFTYKLTRRLLPYLPEQCRTTPLQQMFHLKAAFIYPRFYCKIGMLSYLVSRYVTCLHFPFLQLSLLVLQNFSFLQLCMTIT